MFLPFKCYACMPDYTLFSVKQVLNPVPDIHIETTNTQSRINLHTEIHYTAELPSLAQVALLLLLVKALQ